MISRLDFSKYRFLYGNDFFSLYLSCSNHMQNHNIPVTSRKAFLYHLGDFYEMTDSGLVKCMRSQNEFLIGTLTRLGNL